MSGTKNTNNDDNNNNNNDNDNDNNNEDKEAEKVRMRQELDAMHKEMEVAGYARGKSGQLRRKVPREQAVVRNRKRKLLEEADDARELAITNAGEKEDETRLRGSRAAIEEGIIQGSLVFQTPAPKQDSDHEIEEEELVKEPNFAELEEEPDDDEDEEYDDEYEQEEDDENEEENAEENENDNENDNHNHNHEEPEAKNGEIETEKETNTVKIVSEKNPPKASGSQKNRRRVHRLKNFQSFRMAQRHGDALAAHSRGQPKLAIEKLKQVARDAPSAPQVYSSLGMVYMDMLKESRIRSHQATTVATETTDSELKPADSQTEKKDAIEDDKLIPDPDMAEQLHLAKKAYGSYHVAAILCKKDFSLWLRGADAAADIAGIHGTATTLPSVSRAIQAYHRSERKRWQLEALRDFIVADNLKPPGIDVPAKLASLHMELGNLSEALTILTGLKNRSSPEQGARNEFQSSYKAWLLYANLMLRIGHECMQWNRGVQTNDNYMFRRWLRKLATVFDWQERRLQALSLALESAAGTKSTEPFIMWMQQRFSSSAGKKEVAKEEKNRWHLDTNGNATQHAERPNSPEKATVNIEDTNLASDQEDGERPTNKVVAPDAGESGDEKSLTTEDAGTTDETESKTEQFKTDKKLLLDRNCSELEAFDRTTTDMSLGAESIAAKDRETARKGMLKSHEDAVATLIGENEGQEIENKPVSSNSKIDEGAKMIGIQEHPLTMSASCRQVCTIASELMKHLHGLELYEGARLVGESVSSYLKERAAKHARRIASRKKHEDWQSKVALSPFVFQSYDGANGDAEESDDEAGYFSDEDDLDDDSNSALVDSLRRGVLPPELRVLFGLAMVGEGDRNFVAASCIEAIDDLNQESSLWLADKPNQAEAGDALWDLFRRAMTEPLGRTAAYAFLADVLRKTGKEEEWAIHFSSWFRRHLDTLKSVGMTDALMRLSYDISPYVNFRKNQLLKIILAASRFDIDTAEFPAKRSPVDRQLIVSDDTVRLKAALDAIDSITKVLHLWWKVDTDGSLPPTCIEVVKVSARCFRWFSRDARSQLSYSNLKKVVEQSRSIVAFLCGQILPDFRGEDNMEALADTEWGEFPVQASWQPEGLRGLSLRVYNLSVACNVSLFSGWEPDEFTLRLLRRRHGNKHFGVHLHDRRIAGYLSVKLEGEISQQWEELASLLPSFPAVDFDKRHEAVKQLDWYKTEVEDRKQTGGGEHIARYGEEDGVVLCLAFSALCLHLASSEHDPNVRDSLIQTSLSVLLPISQFCLDDDLWNSDIGEAASTLSGFDEWRLMTGVGPDSVVDPQNKKPTRRRRKAEKAIEKKVQDWIKGKDKSSLHCFITLPTSELRTSWNAERAAVGDDDQHRLARGNMDKVHKATKQLRACYTEKATEKASLQLAVALLDLALQPTCHDPFICLQQAAMFSSQASKAGNSDMTFRNPLPDMNECSPMQALNIAGRADCLHSVYFPNEAAYLCSYVARVCRLHRDREQADFEWNARWKIVAICAYNVSVMIRTMVSTVLDKDMQKSFLSMWERDVVEELERGRSDGWAWKRSLQGTSVVFSPNKNDFENFNLDEEEEEEEHADEEEDKMDSGAEDGDSDGEDNGDEDSHQEEIEENVRGPEEAVGETSPVGETSLDLNTQDGDGHQMMMQSFPDDFAAPEYVPTLDLVMPTYTYTSKADSDQDDIIEMVAV